LVFNDWSLGLTMAFPSQAIKNTCKALKYFMESDKVEHLLARLGN